MTRVFGFYTLYKLINDHEQIKKVKCLYMTRVFGFYTLYKYIKWAKPNEKSKIKVSNTV